MTAHQHTVTRPGAAAARPGGPVPRPPSVGRKERG